MIIGDQDTGTTYYTYRIENSIGAVMLMKELADTVWTTEKIEIKLIRANRANVDVLDEVLIKDLAKWSQEEQDIVIGIKGKCYFNYDLVAKPETSFDVATLGEYLEVKLTSCAAGAKYTVHGAEYFERTTLFVQSETEETTNKEHPLSTGRYDQIILPVTDLTKIKIQKGENSFDITKEEILIQLTLNGEVKTLVDVEEAVANNAVDVTADVLSMFEVSDFIKMDVSEIDKMTIYAKSQYEFTVIRNRDKSDI